MIGIRIVCDVTEGRDIFLTDRVPFGCTQDSANEMLGGFYCVLRNFVFLAHVGTVSVVNSNFVARMGAKSK